jgi:hypothetical protein
MTNEALDYRVNKLEQTNERITQSLTLSEQTRIKLEFQLVELRETFQQDKQKLFELQVENEHSHQQLQIYEQEIDSLNEKLHAKLDKYQELSDENELLRENIKYLQQQLQEKVLQEQEYSRERQLNSNFKDFIQVKRTLQTCQQENEQLKLELKKLQIKLVNKSE